LSELHLKNVVSDILLDAFELPFLNLDTDSKKGEDDIFIFTSSLNKFFIKLDGAGINISCKIFDAKVGTSILSGLM